MATQYLEAWLYDAFDGTNRLSLTDTGGGPFTFSLSAAATLTDALADWQAQANDPGSGLNGTYTFSFSTSTGLVTLACTETFTATMQDSLHRMLGFTAATQAASASYSSDTIPHGFRVMEGLGYEAPQSRDSVDFREYRHSRSYVYTSQFGRWVRINLVMLKTDADALLDGPLMRGKVRVHHTASASVYSATNLDGYLDCYPFTHEGTENLGPTETYVRVIFLADLDE